MKYYKVVLKGFWNENLFTLNTWAYNTGHAMQIASAVYFKCFKNAVITEIPED